MNGISLRLAVLGVVVLTSLGCQGPRHTDRGALLGGLLGAGVGAAIGDKNGNNALPGALVGGAIGAVSGAALGDSIDRDIDRNRRQVAAQYQARQAAGVSPEDVINMTRAGLSEDVIAGQIRSTGVSRSLNVNDLIYLRNQGVPDGAIRAMQQAPLATVAQAPPPPPAGGQPVVVEHHYTPYYYAPPPPPVYWGRYHARPYCPPSHHNHSGSRVSWGFSFSR